MQTRTRVSMNGSDSSVTEVEVLREEVATRARVADQMLSAHARLRDKYARRAALLDVVNLGVSTVLCAVTFVDPQLITAVDLREQTGRILIGALATIVFFL